jgi:RNase P/RNase MRP subunit POP5
MVVKSKRGRRRYIALRCREGTMTDEDLLASLRSSLSPAGIKYKVIQFDGKEGIVRVGGGDRVRAEEELNSTGSRLMTFRTSGTLRTLREEALSNQNNRASSTHPP